MRDKSRGSPRVHETHASTKYAGVNDHQGYGNEHDYSDDDDDDNDDDDDDDNDVGES